MFQAFTKKLLLVFIFLVSSLLIAEDYQPGKHYQVLSKPIATRDPKKIEVIEFFWFIISLYGIVMYFRRKKVEN